MEKGVKVLHNFGNDGIKSKSMACLLQNQEFVNCLMKKLPENKKAREGLLNMFQGHSANTFSVEVANILNKILKELL
jgi:hypothetical protein